MEARVLAGLAAIAITFKQFKQRMAAIVDGREVHARARHIGGAQLDKAASLVENITGSPCSKEDLLQVSMQTLNIERAFNKAAGFGPAHDRIPEYMTIEPMPGLDSVFDVPAEELDRLHAVKDN